jgi:hypothetical protein
LRRGLSGWDHQVSSWSEFSANVGLGLFGSAGPSSDNLFVKDCLRKLVELLRNQFVEEQVGARSASQRVATQQETSLHVAAVRSAHLQCDRRPWMPLVQLAFRASIGLDLTSAPSKSSEHALTVVHNTAIYMKVLPYNPQRTYR